MARLHNRMPVILERDAWPAWLGEAPGDPPVPLHPTAEGVVNLWPVSWAVNSVRNNGAALLDCIDAPEAPSPSDAPAGDNPT
jgi:putative SOS response-associated peptidase YedK